MRSFFYVFIFISSWIYAQDSPGSFLQMGDSSYANFDNDGALVYYAKAVESDSDNYEANWKASRSYVDVGETLSGDDRAKHYKMAEGFARRSIRIKPNGSQGHCYLSIALGRVALDAGPKQRIKMSKEIKKEVDLAIQLDPKNDIAYHVLGRWNRKLANLSWIERGFANMFLGGVPKDASNDNAIAAFKKAIELNPTYINHYLELAITYKMMDEKNMAITNLQKCLDLPEKTAQDKDHKKVAQELLDDLK